jgi:hypothetical protein
MLLGAMPMMAGEQEQEQVSLDSPAQFANHINFTIVDSDVHGTDFALGYHFTPFKFGRVRPGFGFLFKLDFYSSETYEAYMDEWGVKVDPVLHIPVSVRLATTKVREHLLQRTYTELYFNVGYARNLRHDDNELTFGFSVAFSSVRR